MRMEDAAKKVMNTQTEQISKVIDSITKTLEESKNEKAIMPESVFKTFFLDFFYKFANHEVESTTLLKWIELAGGPYNEIDIVDNNANVLFTVPPVYVKPVFVKADGFNVSELPTTFEQKNSVSPKSANSFLNSKLTEIKSTAVVDGNNVQMVWISIFKRYGLGTSKNTVANKKVSEDLGLDYS